MSALPELGNDFHSSASLAQLSLTSCIIGLASGQLLLGPISDVRGRRLPLLIGLILYAVSSLTCIFATSIWMFIALRFIQGVAGSAGLVISRVVLRDLFSGTELTKFSSKLMLVIGVSPIFAPVVGSQILQFASWKGVFIVLSLIGVVMYSYHLS
ncbi:Drug resistance transporter, Bcr/CflA subfamily [Paenibacillus alkaliterrae]